MVIRLLPELPDPDDYPGNPWASNSHPLAAKLSGEGGRIIQRDRCLLLFYWFDEGQGLTNAELKAASLRPEVRQFFGSDHPLGTDPWVRAHDCKKQGWICYSYSGGQPVARMGDFGRPNSVMVLTKKGLKAAQARLAELEGKGR